MAESTLGQRKQQLLGLLMNENVTTVVLVGEPGIGKTWTAREISNCAINKGLFDISLWVFLYRKYDNLTLSDSIARQLSLFSNSWYSGAGDENGESMESARSLHQKISETLAGKKFLLILDDEGNRMTQQEIMSQLNTVLNLNQRSSYKVLITSRWRSCYDSSDSEGTVIEVKPLSEVESLSLLQQRAGTGVLGIPGFKALAQTFIGNTEGFPAAIELMAKGFSYFGEDDSRLQILANSLKEASDGESYNINWLVHTGYDLLPNGILFDFCWRGNHFFRDSGSIHYNELIAYWMMEGYLGRIDRMEEAYKTAHHVLMELIECRMLKKMEADYFFMEWPKMNLDDIVVEGAMMKWDTSHRYGFRGTASLGSAIVFANDKWEGLGEITFTDGMMKTSHSGKQGQELSTLLLDGYSLGGEEPSDFFQSKQLLKVLAIFNPTFRSLPNYLSQMHKLRLLMLRGCYRMEYVGYTLHLKKLTVLEISGPSNLRTIPDDFFEHIPQLQSLNLSALSISTLPASLYHLSELRWLIFKDCSRLETVESLSKLEKLMVLDLSGATSLERIRDKHLRRNQRLQMLNLSRTKIKLLPIINGLAELTHLLLSHCTELMRLSSINSVTSLQILDLSGSCNLLELRDLSLQTVVGLKILDLSGTAVHMVPSGIGNPNHLCLRGCSQLKNLSCVDELKDLVTLDVSETLVKTLPSVSHLCSLRQLLLSCCLNLEELPDLNSLQKLEVLDLSGCIALKEIRDNSFEQMSRLQRLDLSETNISFLPSLQNLINLRHLLLKNCKSLEALPPLDFLTLLEELNLHGVKCVNETGVDFLNHMNHLQILDLSETLLEQLPSLSNLDDLRHLSLRGCSSLIIVPGLEALTKLEVLDLSGTAVSHLPNLKNFSQLRTLLLRDCMELEQFVNLGMLDVLGTIFRELPYGISELTHLEHVDLPNKMNTRGNESRNIKCLPKDHHGSDWFVSGLQVDSSWNCDQSLLPLSNTQFVRLLEENPSLWDTSFNCFHLSVHPLVEPYRKGVELFLTDPSIIRDVYFQNTHFPDFKEQRSLEIRGFDFFPDGIEDILAHTDCLFLIDNPFIRWLSDLGVSNFKVVKGCCIDRCTKMVTVFRADRPEDKVEWGRSLEILGVINAINLTRVYDGNLQCEALQNLRRLYLYCCPKLFVLFSASQLLENLKILKIEFCDKLETVFQQACPEATLPNLEILHLWELPELMHIGCTLPSLQVLKVWGCPKLSNLEEIVQSAKLLEILVISRVTALKGIYTGNLHSESLKNLKSLTLESCPMLVNIVSSSQPPENIETLQIKSCAKLKTVFEQHTSATYTLPKLRTLHLQELPKLERIGVKLPSLEDPVIIKCPNCRDFPVA